MSSVVSAAAPAKVETGVPAPPKLPKAIETKEKEKEPRDKDAGPGPAAAP